MLKLYLWINQIGFVSELFQYGLASSLYADRCKLPSEPLPAAPSGMISPLGKICAIRTSVMSICRRQSRFVHRHGATMLSLHIEFTINSARSPKGAQLPGLFWIPRCSRQARFVQDDTSRRIAAKSHAARRLRGGLLGQRVRLGEKLGRQSPGASWMAAGNRPKIDSGAST